MVESCGRGGGVRGTEMRFDEIREIEKCIKQSEGERERERARERIGIKKYHIHKRTVGGTIRG